MEYGTDNGIFAEEGAYLELKSDTDDFLRKLTDEPFQEFKNQLSIMFQNLQSSFSNVSITQRQLNEVQDKLRRNIRNKNEMIKNIEDDNERYNTLKTEFDNFYLKIDEKKYEETEKEKRIKELQEEIIKLGKRTDPEMLANFNPSEMEQKKKLIEELEDLEKKIYLSEEKKRQQDLLLQDLIKENRNSEDLSKQLDEEHVNLEKQQQALQRQLLDEKLEKERLDKKFMKMKEENQEFKNKLASIHDSVKNAAADQETLQDELDREIEEKNKIMAQTNLKKGKEIPDFRKKCDDIDTKNTELRDKISKAREEIQAKDEEIKEFKEHRDGFEKKRRGNIQKIREKNDEIDKLLKEKNEERTKIEEAEKEIKKEKSSLMMIKNDLLKNNKENDELERVVKKLSNEISDLHNDNVSLGNANQRMVNETYGIKKETQQLELERDAIEKEKNLYAKQASDANMEHTQALEKMKNLTEAINELKIKNASAETKLKQQKKIYEALKADCNRFEKKHQDAQKEIKDVKEEKLKKQHKYQNLKIELSYKQTVYQSTLTSLAEYIIYIT